MPAAVTRQCPRCLQHKPAGVAFRDPGDVTVGRPPKVCAACRAQDPALQARQAANVDRRPGAVVKQRGYAARPEGVRALATASTHPDGLKVCPPESGCGKALPLDAYAPDPYQADGLATRCGACR